MAWSRPQNNVAIHRKPCIWSKQATAWRFNIPHSKNSQNYPHFRYHSSAVLIQHTKFEMGHNKRAFASPWKNPSMHSAVGVQSSPSCKLVIWWNYIIQTKEATRARHKKNKAFSCGVQRDKREHILAWVRFTGWIMNDDVAPLRSRDSLKGRDAGMGSKKLGWKLGL